MAKVMGGAHEKGFEFAKGGTTKMFGRQYANQQQPGDTSHATKDGEQKFAQGGKTKMFGIGHANLAEAGATAKKSQ
jgi:hypothetical protein